MHWGEFVRQKRLQAGYGLRRFAELVGIQPSNYSHMEKGRIPPPQGKPRLDTIAEVLGMERGCPDYHRLMDLAVQDKDKLPADVESYAKQNKLVPALLRTLDNLQLSREEFRRLVQQLNEDLSRPRKAIDTDANLEDTELQTLGH